jgi:hypothetical protein
MITTVPSDLCSPISFTVSQWSRVVCPHVTNRETPIFPLKKTMAPIVHANCMMRKTDKITITEFQVPQGVGYGSNTRRRQNLELLRRAEVVGVAFSR